MSDFYQTGEVATLHDLDLDGLDSLEHELEDYTRQRPIALILPALFSEFQGEAIRRIRDELANVRYLRQIVLALDDADTRQFAVARRFFEGLPAPVVVLWISGKRLQRLSRQVVPLTLERRRDVIGQVQSDLHRCILEPVRSRAIKSHKRTLATLRQPATH